jgi:hypothetical protein
MVIVDGTLSVNILTNPAIDPSKTKGADGMIVMDHEQLHVGVSTSWWAKLVSSVNGIEGVYSSAEAADTAVAAANALARLTYFNSVLENNRLDWDHYGAKASAAEQARIISTMRQAWAARADAQKELNGLYQTWINQGYYKGP